MESLRDAMEDAQWVNFLCDMSAAAVTQLHYRNMIDLNLVWENVSSFFHQAIQMRGFEPIPSPEIEFNSRKEKSNQVEILVAGTQGPDVYKARVDGAISILRKMGTQKPRLTFSGANPAKRMKRMGLQGGVATLNEAADMELYFRKCIEKNPLPKNVHFELNRESESGSTIKNIENFFKRVKLSKDKRNHVYIVSSLFHLPRFIDLMIEQIGKQKIPVSELTFVSSEDPMDKPTDAVGTPDYLKSCMYEFFLRLYKDTPRDQIFKPVNKLV